MNEIRNHTSLRRVAALAGALALLAGAGLARAQDSKDEKLVEGTFDQPLKKSGAASANSTIMMSQSDGDHTYSIKIVGDKVTAEIDGKAVPKDRVVRRDDGQIDILGDDKEVLKTFNTKTIHGALSGGAGGNHIFRIQPRVQFEAVPGNGAWARVPGQAVVAETPKAMIGITMSDAAEDGGVTVDRVMEDKPAEKAGLKPGDRIIEADGKKLDGQQDLRDIIKKKEPGDTLELKVERDGKNVDFKIKLVKFDVPKNELVGAADPIWGVQPKADTGLEQAREALQKALDTLKDEKLDGAKLKARMEKALNDAMEALDKVKAHSGLDGDGMMALPQVADLQRLHAGNGITYVLPHQDDLAHQIDKMNDQLEQLNKRLDELEHKK